jgi:beta-phosphoglucomutase-like phosphatase (HAD superfamily)
MKKLLIWDFDGVIADSEKLWVRAWAEILKSEKQINLTTKEKHTLLYGISDKDRKANLSKHIPGITFDTDFMNKLYKREFYLGTNFMMPIKDVETVMQNKNFEHCIATGATREQHNFKMLPRFQWIRKYIPDTDVFTVDMVERGKPAPDLFLLAAKTKGYDAKDCITIGDSINDFLAAAAANMSTIAFIGATGNKTKRYAKECEKHGVYGVCDNMNDVNLLLNQWYNGR